MALVNGVLPGWYPFESMPAPTEYRLTSWWPEACSWPPLLSYSTVYLGVRWRGGVWLICAAIFYLIWLTLYTTFFTNGAGFFSGIWQGMGYWIAQQEVARGNQPWYYYFLGMSVYELLPVVFGLLGAIYFLLRRGISSAWPWLSGRASPFLIHTLASEKMPWLLVNITLPFILLAGKYLGGAVRSKPPGDRVLRHGLPARCYLLPPLGTVAAGYTYCTDT